MKSYSEEFWSTSSPLFDISSNSGGGPSRRRTDTDPSACPMARRAESASSSQPIPPCVECRVDERDLDDTDAFFPRDDRIQLSR